MKDRVEAAQQREREWGGGGLPRKGRESLSVARGGQGGRTCVGYFCCVPLRCLIESMSPLRAVCERVARLSLRRPSPSSPASDSRRQAADGNNGRQPPNRT